MAETWVVRINNPDNVDLKTVDQSGNVIEVRDIADDAKVALKASNVDGADSVAIEAAGQMKVTAVSGGDPAPASKGIHVINASINDDARALVVEGKAEIPNIYGNTGINGDLGIAGDATVDGATTLGNAVTINQGGLRLLSGGARAIYAEGGLPDHTTEVHIGRFDQFPPAEGGPRIMLKAAIPGNSGAQISAYENDAGDTPDESTLHLATDQGNYDVVISHRDFALQPQDHGNNPTVRIESPRLRVGFPGDGAHAAQLGNIDANGIDAPGQRLELRLATMGVTQNVVIGRTDPNDPTPPNVRVNCPLRVGDSLATAGRIDAAPIDLGGGPRGLEIGTQASTSTVTIGRVQTAMSGPRWLICSRLRPTYRLGPIWPMEVLTRRQTTAICSSAMAPLKM